MATINTTASPEGNQIKVKIEYQFEESEINHEFLLRGSVTAFTRVANLGTQELGEIILRPVSIKPGFKVQTFPKPTGFQGMRFETKHILYQKISVSKHKFQGAELLSNARGKK